MRESNLPKTLRKDAATTLHTILRNAGAGAASYLSALFHDGCPNGLIIASTAREFSSARNEIIEISKAWKAAKRGAK